MSESLQPVDRFSQRGVDLIFCASASVYSMTDETKDKTSKATPESKEVGRRIAKARASQGLSIANVAETLDVSRGSIGHWETGERAIKIQELAALCRTLKVSADELLFGLRRWPFEKIDFDSIATLDKDDMNRLEGALILTAAQLGIEIKQIAA